MVIHTFGDSHSHFCFYKIPHIQTHWVPSILCYTFGHKYREELNIKHYNITDGDSIIFCFGEIDCRAHIYRHVTDTNTYKMIIDDIVDNYFKAIHRNVQQLDNIKTFVYNVVPPSKVSYMQTPEQIRDFVMVKQKNDIPWKGSDEDRKSYHLYFNERLKIKCEEYGYTFFDVYNKYCDNEGFLKRELSDHNVHIEDPIYLKQFLSEHNML